jgi:hypothetical protein
MHTTIHSSFDSNYPNFFHILVDLVLILTVANITTYTISITPNKLNGIYYNELAFHLNVVPFTHQKGISHCPIYTLIEYLILLHRNDIEIERERERKIPQIERKKLKENYCTYMCHK